MDLGLGFELESHDSPIWGSLEAPFNWTWAVLLVIFAYLFCLIDLFWSLHPHDRLARGTSAAACCESHDFPASGGLVLLLGFCLACTLVTPFQSGTSFPLPLLTLFFYREELHECFSQIQHYSL